MADFLFALPTTQNKLKQECRKLEVTSADESRQNQPAAANSKGLC